jgi:hypothetical protein
MKNWETASLLRKLNKNLNEELGDRISRLRQSVLDLMYKGPDGTAVVRDWDDIVNIPPGPDGIHNPPFLDGMHSLFVMCSVWCLMLDIFVVPTLVLTCRKAMRR